MQPPAGRERRKRNALRQIDTERSMDCLIFAAVSKVLAERPEAVVDEDEDDEDEYEDDYLGPEEHRLLRRRRQRRRRQQRELRMRRLRASGLRPGQVQEMEEAVRRSQMILRQPPEPIRPVSVSDMVVLSTGVLGVTSGPFVAGWIGRAVLLVGAAILMLCATSFCLDAHQSREEEEKRAGAEAELARVRAVLERTVNADLLPLHDW